MLVAVSLLSLFASSLYTLVLSLQKAYNHQIALANTQQNARVALSVFSNEIQMAGFDPGGAVFSGGQATTTEARHAPLFDVNKPYFCSQKEREAQPIMEASDTVFHFVGKKNKNKLNDIRYEWVGKSGEPICETGTEKTPYTLYRDNGSGLQEIALGIHEFKLRYFDENGKPLLNIPLNADDRSNIRKVEVEVEVRTGKDTGQLWTSEVILKNMG